MSRTDSNDKSVICPFFRYSDQHNICCEGVSTDSSIKVTFGDPRSKASYKDDFCRDINSYKECRVCKMLFRKHGVDFHDK